MEIPVVVKNLGKLVEGHVLDVNRKQFELELKRIESRLYLKWNPEKQRGYGCWEIRIKPTKLTPVYQCSYRGSKIFTLEPIENSLVHHILDVPFLNYQVLNKLREMDTQGNTSWVDNMDYEAEREDIKYRAKVTSIHRDMIRSNRKYFKQLQEAMLSGYNPFSLFNGVKGR